MAVPALPPALPPLVVPSQPGKGGNAIGVMEAEELASQPICAATHSPGHSTMSCTGGITTAQCSYVQQQGKLSASFLQACYAQSRLGDDASHEAAMLIIS